MAAPIFNPGLRESSVWQRRARRKSLRGTVMPAEKCIFVHSARWKSTFRSSLTFFVPESRTVLCVLSQMTRSSTHGKFRPFILSRCINHMNRIQPPTIHFSHSRESNRLFWCFGLDSHSVVLVRNKELRYKSSVYRYSWKARQSVVQLSQKFLL